MKRKWNWIDTTIVLVIVLAALGFLNRDKLFNRASSGGSNRIEILITVEAPELNDEIVTKIKTGDKIFSQYRLQDAEITEIDVYPTLKTQVGPDGKIKQYEDEQERTLIAKIKANAARSGPYIDLGGQEVKVGINFILKTTEFEVVSKIKHIEVAK